MSLNPLDLVGSLFQWMAPKEQESGQDVLRWRLRMAAISFLLTMGILFLPLLAEWRYIPKAEAEEVHQEIKKEIGEINETLKQLSESDRTRQIREIRKSIYETQERLCRAETGSSLRSVLSSQLADLRSDYTELVGREHPILRCEDF